jgi:arylsulfatase A-like enzyme
LVIHVDQWRAQSAGYAGDRDVITPNLDSLAVSAANFENAVSGVPVCTPYRASFMTGQRPLTNGVFMNDILLDTNAVSIAKVFAASGYSTGYIGKWHLDGNYRFSFTPPGARRQGFQYWKAVNCDHNYNHSIYYDNDDSTRRYWQGFDVIAQSKDATLYIKDHAKDQHPFFLMIAFGPPHNPYYEAPEPYKNRYDPLKIKLRVNVPDSMQQQVRKDQAAYYSQMTAIDDQIGKIITTLKQQGIYDNTILIFTSDHGELMGSHGSYRKQQPYDESIRVPLLIHYSGKNRIKPGNYPAMINAEDIMPTLLGLSAVKIPPIVEGKDFSKYLQGLEKDPKDTVAVIACIQPFGEWMRAKGGKEYRGIRTPRYTFVRDLNGPWLLFDNSSDPYQMNNLVANPAYDALRSELDGILMQKLKEAKDEFLPGAFYLKKFHYPPLNSTGTVGYHE